MSKQTRHEAGVTKHFDTLKKRGKQTRQGMSGASFDYLRFPFQTYLAGSQPPSSAEQAASMLARIRRQPAPALPRLPGGSVRSLEIHPGQYASIRMSGKPAIIRVEIVSLNIVSGKLVLGHRDGYSGCAFGAGSPVEVPVCSVIRISNDPFHFRRDDAVPCHLAATCQPVGSCLLVPLDADAKGAFQSCSLVVNSEVS